MRLQRDRAAEDRNQRIADARSEVRRLYEDHEHLLRDALPRALQVASPETGTPLYLESLVKFL